MSVALLARPASQAIIRTELARRDLADFCALLDPSYEPAEHTARLCAELEAVERGEVLRLAVFMPPRHGKTLHVSERFPAWYLGRHPERQVILASYSAELAESNSRRVRGLLRHPRYPFAAQVSDDSHAVNRWGTTQGGTVIAAGVGGSITGFGAHILVIDDPVKGREEADSEAFRERAWEWYREVARTRLMPGGAIVLCQTRWHEDDLAGRILVAQPGSWRVLSLPAVAEANDQLGRATGESLWPAWFGGDELSALQAELGTRAWSALYQQAPTSDAGGLFRRAWMQRRHGTPPFLAYTLCSVDSAFKTGVANDYSVIATWGTDGKDFYLLDVWRERVEFPDLVHAVKAQAALHKPKAILIEDTAAGQSALQQLRRETPLPLLPVKVTAAKPARAAAVTPLFEAGKVSLPVGTAWLDAWIEEHVAFPTGRFDDQVDTTSMALARLALVAGTGRALPKPIPMRETAGTQAVNARDWASQFYGRNGPVVGVKRG